MQEQLLPASGPKPSDRFIPYCIVVFFIALVLVLVPMCFLAFRTNPGVVTEHAYEKGLAYNKDIAGAQAQNSLHWQSELDARLIPNTNNLNINFTLRDDEAKPIADANITLWLIRPTQNNIDQTIPMIVDGNGHYSQSVTLPAKGLWELRVSAWARHENYQTTRRVIVP